MAKPPQSTILKAKPSPTQSHLDSASAADAAAGHHSPGQRGLSEFQIPVRANDRHEPLTTVSVRGGGSKRQKVLRPLDWLAQSPKQFLQVLIPVDEIDLGCFDHQQVTGFVKKEKMLVCLDDTIEVFIGDFVFNGHILLGDALLERLRFRLQVYHQIRNRDLLGEELIVLVIKSQLRVTQGQVGKNLVLFEQVVADNNPIGATRKVQCAQLLEPVKQKMELRLEARPGVLFIELFQKW